MRGLHRSVFDRLTRRREIEFPSPAALDGVMRLGNARAQRCRFAEPHRPRELTGTECAGEPWTRLAAAGGMRLPLHGTAVSLEPLG